MEKANNLAESLDHISVELEFMQLLTAMEAKAWQEGDNCGARRFQQIQGKFLAKHLSLWIARFCKKVIFETTEEYFRNMAMLTRDFIEMDLAELENSCLVENSKQNSNL